MDGETPVNRAATWGILCDDVITHTKQRTLIPKAIVTSLTPLEKAKGFTLTIARELLR
jgi:hypothetical protein